MKINLGCGAKKLENFTNVDILDYGQEVQADAMQYLYSLAQTKPHSVDEIRADHFLEHFTQDDVIRMLNLCHQCLKPTGTMQIEVPSIQRPEAYYLVHKTLFTLETFTMLTHKEHCEPYQIIAWSAMTGAINNRGNLNVTLSP